MLSIENVNKSYAQRLVLDNLCLRIKSGQVYGLLGPNGAGKTTTINLLGNLIEPDSGIIYINNQPVSEVTKNLIGIAPQENLLYKSLSCQENLNFYAQIYGLRGKKLYHQVRASLEAVNLFPRRKNPVESLSGGMQRRLNIAVALVHEPQLVILDEPTTGLDIESRYEVWDLIRRLQSQGKTILLTTHLLDEAERLCQRIGILNRGSITAEGSLEELRQLVAAQEIVTIKTSQAEKAIARGKELGFSQRRYNGDLAFWLPQSLELAEIINQFAGIPLDSIIRQPVGLEHIYLEVTKKR
ncbi:MAG: ABC transporter ATP-binding protein [Spirulinaceae cyanobacterium]